MNSILKKIIHSIISENKDIFDTFSLETFEIKRNVPINSILKKISQSFTFICEIKKASPSKGVIRNNFHPLQIAQSYEKGGAGAVSVVTEKNYFSGSIDHLFQVKQNIAIPVLRKDFIVHPYQIFQSFNLGADFVLLIAACLTTKKLAYFQKLIQNLGMEALIEVHNKRELDAALEIEPNLIGINNRDLNTFTVDIKTSLELKKNIPEHIPVISESGIDSHEKIMQLKNEGFSGALIGEYLMKQDNIIHALKRLING